MAFKRGNRNRKKANLIAICSCAISLVFIFCIELIISRDKEFLFFLAIGLITIPEFGGFFLGFFSYKQDWRRLDLYYVIFIAIVASLANIFSEARIYWYLFPIISALLANVGFIFGHMIGERYWKDPDTVEAKKYEIKTKNIEN